MSKSKLIQKINIVNKRFAAGKNDDDQVVAMFACDKQTKGWSVIPKYDTYEIISDEGKLAFYVEQFGYWSDQVKSFNSILVTKGGTHYMLKLNEKYTNTANSRKA